MTTSDDAMDSARRQSLSALLDGEAEQVDLACRAWREDARARADWYTYHVIGELMRSDDARCVPGRDARFLARVRARLAAEPVVLAPAAAVARPAPARRAWAASLAVAAGFVGVAGVLVATRVAAPGGASLEQSVALAGSQPLAASSSGRSTDTGIRDPNPADMVAGGVLVRDAVLDRYLAAHEPYGGASVLAVPGGGLRSAVATAPGR